MARGPRANRSVENQTTAQGARARALRGADLVVVRANSRCAPHQLHGHGSVARPPHHDGGCGFEAAVMLRLAPVARGPRAHRPVENQTTAHRARARALRGRYSLARRPRLGRTATESCRRLWLRAIGDTEFDPKARGPRAHRSVENQPTAHRARACTARCDLGCGGANAGRGSPQLHGRGSAARPPHQVGGCGFEQSMIPRSAPVAGGPRAHRPVDNRTTAHGVRAHTLRGEDLVVVRSKT